MNRLRILRRPRRERLYWYHDGRLLGDTQPGSPFFVPLRPGRHRIAVVGDQGAREATWLRCVSRAGTETLGF